MTANEGLPVGNTPLLLWGSRKEKEAVQTAQGGGPDEDEARFPTLRAVQGVQRQGGGVDVSFFCLVGGAEPSRRVCTRPETQRHTFTHGVPPQGNP